MEVVRNVARMQHLGQRLHVERKQVGLIPTWGGLHEGHLALIRRVQDLVDTTIVSILPFIGDGAGDISQHDQAVALTNDVEFLVPTQIDYIFAPKMSDFRDPDAATEVLVHGYSERLYAPLRPGFYNQATTLLATLLTVLNPNIICMGRKDPQLVAIVNHLVSELHFACQVVAGPIVREPDGVAASWWIQKMKPEERQAASLVYKGLEKAQVLYGAGERNAHELIEAIRELVQSNPLIQIDYIGIVDAETLEPLGQLDDIHALAAVAVKINEAMLIDNILLSE